MNVLSTLVLCAASVVFYVGLYHLIFYLRSRTLKENLSFALLCFAIVYYDIASAGLYNALTPAQGAVWQRWQLISLALAGMLLLWFVSEFIGRKSRCWDFLFIGIFVVNSITLLFERGNLTITDIPAVKHVPFWWGSREVVYNEMELGPIAILQGAIGLVACVYVLASLIIHYRAIEKKKQREMRPLLIGILVLVGGILHDTAVGWGVHHHVYVIEFTYLCLMMCMAFALSGRYLRAEKDLRETADELMQLAAAVEAAPESIVITDPKGVIKYVNPSFEQMTGYTRAEVLGKSSDIVNSGKHDKKFYEEMWATIADGKAWRGTFTNRKKDGTLFQEEAVISPVRDDSGEIVDYVAVKRDVTQQRALESQLRQSQKMEAVGRLASGVAHDFTNSLVVILGHTQVAKTTLPENSDTHKHLDAVVEAANKLSSLTGELLAFAHQKKLSLRIIDLNRVVNGMTEMLQRTLGKEVRLEVLTSEEHLTVEIDADLMEQAIVHLAVNSLESIDKNGRIKVSTSMIDVSQNEALQFQESIDQSARVAGSFALLSISDTGCGMTREMSAHVFDPFFTTKGKGRSTGLGLTTCYGIVSQHSGFITVHSNPGYGTTFNIFIPLADQVSDGESIEADSGTVLPKDKVVLVVEDHAMIRGVLIEILKKLGCSVLEAENGRQALILAEERGSDIDLVMTDVIMPDMDGVKLSEELKKRNPGIKVLFGSGYPKDHLVESGLMKDGLVVNKPYTRRNVLRGVREILLSCPLTPDV